MVFKHFPYASLASTNEKAKSMVQKEPCPFVISAKTQTKGKGQHGKSFHSPKDLGLYFSVVVDYHLSIEQVQTLNLEIGNVIANVLNKTFNINTHSVYPNDVYYKDRKLVGILSEGIYDSFTLKYEAIIVGVGLNLFKDNHLPESLKETVITLEEITPNIIDQEKLLDKLIGEIIAHLRKGVYEK